MTSLSYSVRLLIESLQKTQMEARLEERHSVRQIAQAFPCRGST